MVLVRETCEYHSRGEEYMVLFWRDLWVPQQTRGISICLGEACLCQLLTDKSALCLPKTMSCLSWLQFDS